MKVDVGSAAVWLFETNAKPENTVLVNGALLTLW